MFHKTGPLLSAAPFCSLLTPPKLHSLLIAPNETSVLPCLANSDTVFGHNDETVHAVTVVGEGLVKP